MATAREAQLAPKQSPIYRFGDREVDTRLRQIQVRGEILEAQPKAFDLLVYLIENRDRVVDRDELLEQLWSGTVVSDSALTQIVYKARSLAGDDGDRQAAIRTVQRRGFRFVAVVEVRDGASTAGPPYADATAEPSVAVLPFADMSPEHDQEYFCDGMVEEIITELTRVPGLRVAARTSSFAFKNRADDVREIGRRLGVSTVLEGSVRKVGDRLRVTAQLIDAATGFHHWSERWDRTVEDMLAIQAEIGQQIAAVLRGSHVRSERAAVTFTADDLCDGAFADLNRTSQRSQRFAERTRRRRLNPASVGSSAARPVVSSPSAREAEAVDVPEGERELRSAAT